MNIEEITHAGNPGVALCKNAAPGERVVPLEQIEDPDHPAAFSCGTCLAEINGGAEPSMGGAE